MDPALIAVIFGGALQILDSIRQAQGGELTNEQLDALRAASSGKLSDFLKLTEGNQ